MHDLVKMVDSSVIDLILSDTDIVSFCSMSGRVQCF
jgi:hypothetical protein